MSDNSIWVIVKSYGDTYIGAVDDDYRVLLEECDSSFPIIVLTPCYRIHDEVIKQPTAQGLVLSRQVMALPIGPALESTEWHVKPTAYCFFHDMSPADAIAHEKLVEDCEKMLIQQRAARSGITMAGQMPPTKGPMQ